jgi:hypothetical protein
MPEIFPRDVTFRLLLINTVTFAASVRYDRSNAKHAAIPEPWFSD